MKKKEIMEMYIELRNVTDFQAEQIMRLQEELGDSQEYEHGEIWFGYRDLNDIYNEGYDKGHQDGAIAMGNHCECLTHPARYGCVRCGE